MRCRYFFHINFDAYSLDWDKAAIEKLFVLITIYFIKLFLLKLLKLMHNVIIEARIQTFFTWVSISLQVPYTNIKSQ